MQTQRTMSSIHRRRRHVRRDAHGEDRWRLCVARRQLPELTPKIEFLLLPAAVTGPTGQLGARSDFWKLWAQSR